MELLSQTFWLSLGGALGVNARHWLGLAVLRWAGASFPWATFVINVSGSLAIGFLTITLARWLPHHLVRLHVVTGLLGGYTTYSTFANESFSLWERDAKGLALLYIGSTVVAGFAAVAAGVALGRWATGPDS